MNEAWQCWFNETGHKGQQGYEDFKRMKDSEGREQQMARVSRDNYAQYIQSVQETKDRAFLPGPLQQQCTGLQEEYDKGRKYSEKGEDPTHCWWDRRESKQIPRWEDHLNSGYHPNLGGGRGRDEVSPPARFKRRSEPCGIGAGEPSSREEIKSQCDQLRVSVELFAMVVKGDNKELSGAFRHEQAHLWNEEGKEGGKELLECIPRDGLPLFSAAWRMLLSQLVVRAMESVAKEVGLKGGPTLSMLLEEVREIFKRRGVQVSELVHQACQRFKQAQKEWLLEASRLSMQLQGSLQMAQALSQAMAGGTGGMPTFFPRIPTQGDRDRRTQSGRSMVGGGGGAPGQPMVMGGAPGPPKGGGQKDLTCHTWERSGTCRFGDSCRFQHIPR